MALQGLRTAFTNRGGEASAEAGVPVDPVTGGASAGEAAFRCPSCDRTLDRGTRRCEGCGQRLLLDVPARTAGRLIGGGVVAGFMVGGILVGLTLPRGGASSNPAADAAANGNGNGANVTVNAPVPALAALRGTTALNGRLASRADDLAAALSSKKFPAGDVVPVLRRLSQDTRAGAAMVKSFGTWPEAAEHQAALGTFYETLAGQIDGILAVSVRDAGAYKAATQQIMKTLGQIPTLDDQARLLAAQAGTDLPPLAIPDSLK
jgi:hypothetical protein